jgi:hypothetical protein
MDRYFLQQIVTAFTGGLMDPFVLAPSAIVGAVVPYRWLRAALAVAIGAVVTVIFVWNLDSLVMILPSDKPRLWIAGSLARGAVAWGMAEITTWARRRAFAAR